MGWRLNNSGESRMGQWSNNGRMECLGPIALSLQLRDDGAAADGEGDGEEGINRRKGVKAMNEGSQKCVQNTGVRQISEM